MKRGEVDGGSQVVANADPARALSQYIRQILRHQSIDDSSDYHDLVHELHGLLQLSKTRVNDGESTRLTCLLHTLVECASEIDVQHHASLFQAIINTQFIDQPSGVRMALTELMKSWMLKNCTTIPGCLSAFAISLVPFLFIDHHRDQSDRWTPPEALLQIHELILDAIDYVYELIPAIGENFLKRLHSKQPYVKRPCVSHALYLTSIFSLMKRPLGAHFREKLWAMAVQHLVDVDIHIHVGDLNRQADLGKEVENEGVFFCEIGQRECQGRRQEVSTMLNVMDTLMELTFMELESTVCNEERLKEIWRVLLTLLDVLLIGTDDIQFAHYLLFYVAQRSQSFVDDLVQKCLERMEDRLLSRIAPVSTKLEYLDRLLSVCERHAAEYAKETVSGPATSSRGHTQASKGAAVHQVFYAASQAIMYLLCFLAPPYLRDDVNGIGQQVREMIQFRLSPLIYHWLEPFNYVASVVAIQFTQLTEKFGILNFSQTLKQDRLCQQRFGVKASFPFDPYCLHRSSRFLDLESAYITWSEISEVFPADMSLSEDECQKEEQEAELTSVDEPFSFNSSMPLFDSAHSSTKSDRWSYM